jgi:hypothetical protein
MSRKPQKARQIGKDKLLGLVKLIDHANSRMAEERGALGGKLEAAATSDNFDAKALRPLLPLLKLDTGPQAHRWRTILLYADHLGIGAQSDLEDYMDGDAGKGEGGEDEDDEDDGDGAEAAGSDGDQEAVADARALASEATGGEPEADPIAAVLGGMTTPALGRFRTSLVDCVTVEAVNRGLERFTADHPDDAEAALDLAQARLEELGAEAGGGEDIRPTALREAEKAEAADTVHAATGKKPRKPRKPKDAPVPEAPAFGGREAEAGGSVH